jgi:hypothetical protein
MSGIELSDSTKGMVEKLIDSFRSDAKLGFRLHLWQHKRNYFFQTLETK